MPRGSGGSSALVAVQSCIGREANYRESIQHNNSICSYLGEIISIDGNTERDLLESLEDDDDKQKDELMTFLNEQREKIKTLSEKNIHNSRNVDAFINSLNGVKEQITITSQQQQQSNDNVVENLPDYEKIIIEKMNNYHTTKQNEQIEIKQESMYLDVCKSLGEKINANQNNNNDDDELEVINENRNNESSLKCPITLAYFVNPVRNKVCHHVYSLEGITQHLHSSRSCPVAGCNNMSLSKSQLEKDNQMEMRVKRQIRADEAAKLQSQMDAHDADDDDDDEM